MKPIEQSTLSATEFLREHETNRLAHLEEKLRPHSTLAWAAIALGLTFGIAGILHTTAVISVALKQGKPYNFRLVSLLATGGILIYPYPSDEPRSEGVTNEWPVRAAWTRAGL